MKGVKNELYEVIRQVVLNDTNKERIEAFEERAAIMEFDGGLNRQEAERLAFEIVYKKHLGKMLTQ